MPLSVPNNRRLPFVLWAGLPMAVGAWLRWQQLGELEPFVDEAGNILTALDSRVHAIVEPLAQGRPLLGGLFTPAGWFPGGALTVGRMMSGLSGLTTMAAVGWCLYRLGGRTAGLWGLWLWAFLPIAVWHERLALQDPFVTAALAWSVVMLVTAHESHTGLGRLAWGSSGVMFGVAFLHKISAVLALPWLGLLYIALRRHHRMPLADRRLGWLALGAAVPVLCLGKDLPLLGSRAFHYQYLPDLSAHDAASGISSRFIQWVGWYPGYGGWSLVLLMVAAVMLVIRIPQHRMTAGCLMAGWVVSLGVSSGLYNHAYARYALPDYLPLILFVGLALGSATEPFARRLALVAGLVALLGWGATDWQIGRRPASAPVPAAEVTQYVTGPWSGRGTAEVREFLTSYADQHRVQCVVLTHRFMRPGCYALMLAGLGDPRIVAVPLTVYEPEELALARRALAKLTVGTPSAFFVLYEGSLYPAHPWLDQPAARTRLALTVERGRGETFRLYQFEP